MAPPSPAPGPYDGNNYNTLEKTSPSLPDAAAFSSSSVETSRSAQKHFDSHIDNDRYTPPSVVDEEEGDEPDSMTADSMHKDKLTASAIVKSEVPRVQNGNLSGDEEMEDEGKLVIDDNTMSTPSRQARDKCHTCQICGYETDSRSNFYRHLSSSHGIESTSFQCDFCDFCTHDVQMFTTHRKMHFSTGYSEIMNDTVEKMNVSRDNFLGVDSLSSSRVETPNESMINEDDMDESNVSLVTGDINPISMPLTITTNNIDQVLDDDKKKKKKTRQEVDPGKYFEVVDGSGTKYACSQCGNIYKWRKSLNKHWKEKHLNDPLVEKPSPPGMLELLKSGKYTQLGARRIYDNGFLATIKTQKDDTHSSRPSSSPVSDGPSPSPPNFLTTAHNFNSMNASRLAASVASAMIPSMIGPFVANGGQPVFPGMPIGFPMLPLHNRFTPVDDGALDLSRDSIKKEAKRPFPVTPKKPLFDQDTPLDFSNKADDKNVHIKNETLWEEMHNSMKPAHSMNQYIPKTHRCSKCDYTSTSEVDFANHTSSHLNKRIVRCFECKVQLNSMDELNTHFIQHHNKKLSDHKEAIKKIPHGLQQTYHLLEMDKIGDIGSQDLGATDSKSLKCKKCDFEAKWPAELQKHAVSHSEERPYICMVCGSTYKWKWDLVKHFQKSHPNLPNPYRRNDKRDTPECSSEDEIEEEPEAKRARLAIMNAVAMNGASPYTRDDMISVEGIIAATQAGQRFVSSQPHLDGEVSPVNFLNGYSYFPHAEDSQEAFNQSFDQRESAKNRGSAKKNQNQNRDQSSPGSSSGRAEDLPYKCPQCNYHARWPSEVTQHMKNHSDSKPYLCPRCEYRSKWKWDVVKHLKRCGGGGGIDDVIDTTKPRRREGSVPNSTSGPPNAVVSQQGKVKKTTPQPSVPYMMPSFDDAHQSSFGMKPSHESPGVSHSMTDDLDQSSAYLDTSNNNDNSYTDNNINNNYATYSNGQPLSSPNAASTPIASTAAPSSLGLHTGSLQNSNAEIWNCDHCAFTTQSQAELKRHSGLHSEDKPFKCDICHYSTRWACDLKKHRKSYNHFPMNRQINNTTTADQSPMVKDIPEKSDTVKNRFKCVQCNLFFQHLQNLLDHRKSEHVGRESAQSSPVPQAEENEIDAARIKHPRKPIKQIACPKCAFLCRNRNTMEKHLEEHEIQELNCLKCFYCPQQFKDKEYLLDHITCHPAFNPKEWETFFMINEDEEEQTTASKYDYNSSLTAQPIKKENADVEQQTAKVLKELEKVTSKSEATKARIQQILDEIPKQKNSAITPDNEQPENNNKFKCEWCPAEFATLTAAYKHASQSHPIQLKEQDVSMTGTTGPSNKAQIKSERSHDLISPNGKYPDLDYIRHLVIDGQVQKAAIKMHEIANAKPRLKSLLALNMKEDFIKKGEYHCDMCPFVCSNLKTFGKHYDLHFTKPQNRCSFCEYTDDRIHVLYQHMKMSHAVQWKALSQDPRYASQIEKFNMAYASYTAQNNISDNAQDQAVAPLSSTSGAIDLSAKTSHAAPEMTHDIVYNTRQQYTWSGIPVNVIPVEGSTALNFVCPNCSYNDISIAQTCSHVMQSHRAMTKFKCKTCSFCDDNIHVMSDHCKTHPIHERVVEVVDFKQLNFSEFQILQLNAAKEIIAHDLSASVKAKKEKDDASSKKILNCPFCPYKSLKPEELKSHLSNHSTRARYRCQMCDFSSSLTDVISDHVKVHEPNYTADSKSEASVQNLSMNKSQIKEEPESDAKPKLTESTPDAASSADLTKEGSPKLKSSGRIRYRCSVCPYHTTCKSNILKHKRQHLHNKRYKCSKCSYSAARAVLLKRHLDAHDVPLEEDGLHHDIFCNPNSPNDDLRSDNEDMDIENEADLDADDIDDDDNISDDMENEMDAKAIADLEAKDIMEAEVAHKASILLDEEENENDSADKPLRKQKCPHCPFSSNSGFEFRKHLGFHGTQERFKCDMCTYSLDRLNLLSQHRKLHCDEAGYNPNPLAADLLNTSFIYQQQNTKATDGKDVDAMMNTEFGHFTCTSCPYKTTQKNLLDTHINSHALKKRYICDYCDWSADRVELVHQHRRVHDSEVDFNHDIDEKAFINEEFDIGSSGEFEAKYMEIKNSDKPVKEGENDTGSVPPFKLTVVKKNYPCRLCPFKTSSRNSYSVHKSMHGSGAEFSCSECTYAVVNRGLLQQHMHLHTTATNQETASLSKDAIKTPPKSQEPQVCETGSDEEAINLSSKSSADCKTPPNQTDEKTSSKPLLCTLCPFTTSSSKTLSDHLKTHSVHEKLICPHCDYVAISTHDFYPHLQSHFPSMTPQIMSPEQNKAETVEKNNNNNNMSKEDKNQFIEQSTPLTSKVVPTRIYACRYCDREFEVKAAMLQHENQH